MSAFGQPPSPLSADILCEWPLKSGASILIFTCERGVRLGLSEPVLRLAGVVSKVLWAEAADVEGEAAAARTAVEQLPLRLVQLLVPPEPRDLQAGLNTVSIWYIDSHKQ